MNKIFDGNGQKFCEKCNPQIEEHIQKKEKTKGVMIHENHDTKSHEPTGSVGVA